MFRFQVFPLFFVEAAQQTALAGWFLVLILHFLLQLVDQISLFGLRGVVGR